jgi:GDP-4-dehydro-6-deoxy-D-mannose reductase
MSTLIIGSSGFIGSKLTESLEKEELYTLNRGKAHCIDRKLFCSFSSSYEIAEIIKIVDPLEKIYVLIGSFTNSPEDIHTNVTIPLMIMEAVMSLEISPRVLLVGSAAEYGATMESQNFVFEEDELAPVSIYGLTKTLLFHTMEFYSRVHQLDIVYARIFNVIGAGMSPRLLFGRVYEEIVKTQPGEDLVITTGSLESCLDYLPVEEISKNLIKVMENGKRGHVYNVASGKTVKVKKLLISFINEHFSGDYRLIVNENNKSRITHSCASISKLNSLKK